MSLELIRALRARTGASMVHCKLALADAPDIEAAAKLIEERGQAVPANLEHARPRFVEPAASTPSAPPQEEEAVPDAAEEAPILAAIRAKDEALATRLLAGRSAVSVALLEASLSHATGLGSVALLHVPRLAGQGYAIARRVGASHGTHPHRAAVLDKLLDVTPPGVARADVMLAGMGLGGADVIACAMRDAVGARKGSRAGVVVRDVAVLLSNTDRIEAVRHGASHEHALSIVEEWVGVRPTQSMAPTSVGANAPAPTRAPAPKPVAVAPAAAKGSDWVEKWSVRTEFGDYPRPIVADGVVWCLVRGDWISAHDLETGTPRWEVPFAGAMHGVAVSESLVFITCSAGVLALRREDGAELWRRAVGSKMWVDSSPLIDGARGFHLSHAGVHAVSLDDGRELWSAPCVIRDYSTLIDLGTRLLVPTHAETLILDKESGAVVERLPIQGDLAVRLGGPRPAVLIARAGKSRFHWLVLDDGSRGSGEILSVSDEHRSALPINRLAVSGSRVFATTLDWRARFCFDVDVASGKVQLVRETPGEQHFAITADATHAYTYTNGRIDVLDPMLRPIDSFESGVRGGICPRVVPTQGGVFVSSDGQAAYFQAPASARAPLATGTRTFTQGLAAPVLAQIERLSGVLPDSVRQRVLQMRSGAVELSGPLSLYLGVSWAGEMRLDAQPPRPIDLFDGDLATDLARDYEGPLVLIGQDGSQWSYVIRAHDESADPVVFALDHDGSDDLRNGKPLSAFLAKITRAT